MEEGADPMSVQRRGKRWTARIYVGKAGMRSGWRWLGTFDSKREATDALAKAQLERHRHLTAETCDHFAARWVADYPRERASTNQTNRHNIKRFAEDFRGVKLSDVDRPMARAWALANRTYARYARALFEDALNDGLVADNPFARLRLPQSRGRRDLVALTEDQVEQLGDVARDAVRKAHGKAYAPVARAVVLFLAHVGVRPGELQALTWSDVNLRRGEARIARSRSATGELTETKTYRARTVLVPPPALAAITAMPRRADAEYVFLSPSGRGLSKGSLFYVWSSIRPAAQAKGLPVDDLYELRHAAATMLLERGASRDDVAVQLGNSPREIERTYGHPSEDAARDRLRRAYGENVRPLREVSDAGEMHG